MKRFIPSVDLQCTFCDTPFRTGLWNAIAGKTRSCGCIALVTRKQNGQKKRIHGHANPSRSRTYISWVSMIQRCTNPDSTNYKYWGGRGITVCERWKEFPSFLADMGLRPSNTSLDRIDNNGNYEPKNCRWATSKQQNNNTRDQQNLCRCKYCREREAWRDLGK